MNLKRKGIVFLQMAMLSLSLVAFTGCKNSKEQKDKQIIESIKPEAIHDTLLLEQDTLYVEIPVPYTVIKDSIIYVNNPVDTFAILRMFAEKKIFRDTLRFDYGYIAITDSVSGGSIVSRNFIPKFKIPTKERIQTVKEDPTSNFYLGLNGGFDRPNYVYSLGTSLLYQTPGKKIYEIGIGVWNRTEDGIYGQFVPYIHGGVFWKLNLKTKKK